MPSKHPPQALQLLPETCHGQMIRHCMSLGLSRLFLRKLHVDTKDKWPFLLPAHSVRYLIAVPSTSKHARISNGTGSQIFVVL